MSARYMKKSIRVSRLWILICVVLALVVGTIAYFWVTQGRFPLAPAASQAGSEPVSSQQNSTAGISSALESSASANSGSSSSAVMNALTYTNKEYGFTFALPQDFEGYTILNEEWEGPTSRIPPARRGCLRARRLPSVIRGGPARFRVRISRS